VKLVELMGHPDREGRSPVAAPMRQSEGPGDIRVGDLKMLATVGDGGACLRELALSVADLDW
jgi:hypothetical protein